MTRFPNGPIRISSFKNVEGIPLLMSDECVRAPSLTPVSHTDTRMSALTAVLAAWKITHQKIQELNRFHYNSVPFLITGADGREYCLKQMTGPRWKSDAFFGPYNRLTSALQIPSFIHTPDGKPYTEHEGSKWVLLPGLKNARYYQGSREDVPLVATAIKEAQGVLSLHQDPELDAWIKGGPQISPYGYMVTKDSVASVLALSKNNPSSVEEVRLMDSRAILREECEALLAAAQIVESRLGRVWDSLPRVWCHGDAISPNILISEGRAYSMDWEKVLKNPAIYDVGTILGATVRGAAFFEGLAAANHAELALVTKLNEEGGEPIDRDNARAAALLQALHLAIINIKNVFEAGKSAGIPSFEKHVRFVGELLKIFTKNRIHIA